MSCSAYSRIIYSWTCAHAQLPFDESILFLWVSNMVCGGHDENNDNLNMNMLICQLNRFTKLKAAMSTCTSRLWLAYCGHASLPLILASPLPNKDEGNDASNANRHTRVIHRPPHNWLCGSYNIMKWGKHLRERLRAYHLYWWETVAAQLKCPQAARRRAALGLLFLVPLVAPTFRCRRLLFGIPWLYVVHLHLLTPLGWSVCSTIKRPTPTNVTNDKRMRMIIHTK